MTKEKPGLKFTPSPGIIIVDPIEKTQKSTFMAVADERDDPHRGLVVAIGDPKPYESNPEILQQASCKVGDIILYSIMGIEKTRLEYDGDLRHQFVIVPFNRTIGVIHELH